MTVREVTPRDRVEWLRMRQILWPAGTLADHDLDTRRYFEGGGACARTFVAEDGDTLIGFLELDERKYAPGCASSPVPFIEGLYVEASSRRHGVARALVAAAETWSREAGFSEIASDVDLTNEMGLAAHGGLGFQEIERIACFRRAL